LGHFSFSLDRELSSQASQQGRSQHTVTCPRPRGGSPPGVLRRRPVTEAPSFRRASGMTGPAPIG